MVVQANSFLLAVGSLWDNVYGVGGGEEEEEEGERCLAFISCRHRFGSESLLRHVRRLSLKVNGAAAAAV